jgi:RNA polymerase sigma factor (sigma-70 family)
MTMTRMSAICPSVWSRSCVIEVDAVWHAVDRLPPRQRAVLYLRYRADLPYERIGLALGITPNAARGHASTGLGTLRRRLHAEDER